MANYSDLTGVSVDGTTITQTATGALQIAGGVIPVSKIYNHAGGTNSSSTAENTKATITIPANTFSSNFSVFCVSNVSVTSVQGVTARLKINGTTKITNVGTPTSTDTGAIEINSASLNYGETGLDCTQEQVIIVTLQNANSTAGRNSYCRGLSVIATTD